MKIRPYLGLKLCLLCLTAFPKILFAQIVQDPSFEGPPRENIPPENWIPCHEFSTPDTQPSFWEVTKEPSDGNTYISLVTRGNQGPYANTVEDVATTLLTPLAVNDILSFAIDLAFSENWGHTIGFGSTFLNYDTPARLKIFGGSNSCKKTELLWESEVIDHYDWRTYIVLLAPQEIDVNFLILQADYTTESTEFGNIMVDNIQECSVDVTLASDTTICEHKPLILDVTIPGGTYEWQDGSTLPTYTITTAGIYQVTVSGVCETKKFEIEVTTRNCICDAAVPIQTVPFDSVTCEHLEIILDAETPGGSYSWNTGSDQPAITVKEPGLYTVEVSNKCETKTFDYQIETIKCTCEIYAPNVFTPNGDGVNETLEIRGTQDISRYKLTVFNESGSKVFETNQLDNYWDGTSNGYELPTGVYYYSVEVGCYHTNTILDNSYKGWVKIMR